MLRVKSPQDLGAGLVFVLIGLAGLYFGSDLTFGTAARMGPGYFPILLSAMIAAVGELGVPIRAGLHTGEVAITGGQARGLAVHPAGRAGR